MVAAECDRAGQLRIEIIPSISNIIEHCALNITITISFMLAGGGGAEGKSERPALRDPLF